MSSIAYNGDVENFNTPQKQLSPIFLEHSVMNPKYIKTGRKDR
jgi:hypothetical protein